MERNYEANFSFFILLHKRAKPIAKTKPVKLTEQQIFHNKIVGNPVVVGVVSTMQILHPLVGCTVGQ